MNTSSITPQQQKPVIAVITAQQRRILLLTTGLDRSAVPYRNAFVCSRDSQDDDDADGLMELGLMTRAVYPFRPINWLYQVTPQGLEMARAIARRVRETRAVTPGQEVE